MTQLLHENKSNSRWIFIVSGLALLFMAVGLFIFTPLELPPLVHTMFNDVIQALAFTVLGGFAVLIFAALRRLNYSVIVMLVVALLLLVKMGVLLPLIDGSISSRTAVRIAQERWPDFSPHQSASWQLSRSHVYQLNYYLHTELGEWTPAMPKPEWIFVKGGKQREAAQQGFDCGIYIAYPSVLPCRKIASVSGLQGLAGNSSSGGIVDGQAR